MDRAEKKKRLRRAAVNERIEGRCGCATSRGGSLKRYVMPYQGEILAGMYQIVGEIGARGAGIIYKADQMNRQKNLVV